MIPQFICHPDFARVKPLPILVKATTRRMARDEQEQFLCRHILFRKQVCLPKTNGALLHITADDYYKLYINGQFVAMGPAPGYPWRYYYNTVDVSPYLKEGQNTIAVHTYYQGLNNLAWVSSDRRQSFWCELQIDGQTVLCSDTTWKCTNHRGFIPNGYIKGYQTAFYENYDSNSPEEGFEKPDYDDSDWGTAAIYQYANYTLVEQPTGQLDIYNVEPQTVEQIEGGLRLDFGQNAVGYLSLAACGQKGDVVELYCGEELNDDGGVRYEMRCNCTYAEKWTLSGGSDTLHQYEYKAFRYAEVKFPPTVRLTKTQMTVRHYPFTQKLQYNTQNETLRQILDLCVNTIKYGTQECLVDCPHREKGQYLGDLSVSGRAQALLTGDMQFMKKSILESCASAKICPGLMSVCNAGQMHEIADYSLQLPAQIAWVYAHDGDAEFVKQTLPCVMGIYHHFLQFENEDGLLEQVTDKWNLVDWPQNLRDDYDFLLTNPIGPGAYNVLNAFWVGFLQSVDELLAIAGQPVTGRTEVAKQAFIKAFYCKETGLFADAVGTTHTAVHSTILPLLFGIGTEDEALKNRMINHIVQKGLTCMGVYMAYFALAALVQNGRQDLAEQLATAEGCWQLMLRQGATTTFEAWGKEQKSNCSLFHPWAVAPLIVFADTKRVY